MPARRRREHAPGYVPALLVWEGTVTDWTHIAVVYEDKQPRLYINGTLVRTGLVSPRDHVNMGTFLGGMSDHPDYDIQTMDGQMDEVRVWNYIRTPEQIAANMNSTVPTPQSGLAAYWPINESDEDVLTDISGNGNDVELNSNYGPGNWSALAPLLASYKDGYRYGFNEKENDNEVKGEGNQQDYGMRIYDTRLGRFLSVDPITADYPWLTPFQYASNVPIVLIDQDGLEGAFKLPDGRIYFHPPSDNLKIPIPTGAVPLGPMTTNGTIGARSSASFIADFIPIKGWQEAITGVDVFTNQQLSIKDRIIGIIPFGRNVRKVSKVLNATTTVTQAQLKAAKAAAMVERLKRKARESNGQSIGADKQPPSVLEIPNAGNRIGKEREQLAAKLSGGKVAPQVNGKDFTVTINTGRGKISASVDVIGKNGEYITVGGPSKESKLGSWGDHLTRLKEVAASHGTVAKAYLDSNSSQSLIDFTKKKLGDNNVIIMKNK